MRLDTGGFAVIPDVVFNAATKLVGTKDFVYAIASGLVADLHVSAGMAGDDQIGHDFAAKYEPAAAALARAISSAGQAVGVTGSKLLTMAVNYLAADDAEAARYLSGIDTGSYALARSPTANPSRSPGPCRW